MLEVESFGGSVKVAGRVRGAAGAGAGAGTDPALAAVGEENENGKAGEVREDLQDVKWVKTHVQANAATLLEL